jgi:hypothetical protein
MKTFCSHLAYPPQLQLSHQVYYRPSNRYRCYLFVRQLLSNVNLISDFYCDHRLIFYQETQLSRSSGILHTSLKFAFLVRLSDVNTKGYLGVTSSI